MALTLTILRCPDDAAPETRRLTGGELRIGRDAARADWVLRDPGQTLSRQHCVVRFDGAQWQVADTSTNGTFLNRDAQPIGAAAPRTLRDNDRIRLGAYEIEARIEADTAANPFGGGYTPFESARPADPFADPPPPGESLFGGGSMALDDNMFADPFPPPPSGPPPAQRDHSAAFTDAMPPQTSRAQLMDDWEKEFEFLGNPAPPAPAFTPPPPPPPPPIVQEVPVVQPNVPPPGLDPFAEASDPPPATKPAPAYAPQSAALPRPAASPVTADAQALVAAFMDGAGLGDLTPQDPLTALHNAGAAFRAFVSGLREALMVRAEIKSAMRIDQTFIRARGNNPLKFSAGDDDALTALLGTGRRTDMTPQAAVSEALRDLRHHEQATMPAVQTALRSLLDRLDPAIFRATGDEQGGFLPAQKRARAFEAYEAEYAKLRAALADDFDTVFGRRFSEAYEAMVDDFIKAERNP
jgi:type VI secretion system protein ImpI/type VI secretion system protein